MTLQPILEKAVSRHASDVHIVNGWPVMLRIDGILVPLQDQRMQEEDIFLLSQSLLKSEDYETLLKTNTEIDHCFSLNNIGRFRVNAYKQQGNISLAIRCLPASPPTLEELHLPAALPELAMKHAGILLVTGPTGSGKSTSLAAMIRLINETQHKHIITIEDPIEYLHAPQKSIISQREIGKDTTSFAAALRAALRQDPDVILVGEMRDLETIQTALTASETGHLVLSTLHTNGAVETINRIIDVFPTHQQQQIRLQLAANITGILSQQLLPMHNQAGRIAATEFLVPTSAIRHMIREGKTHQIQSSLTMGAQYGMHTMDTSLANLLQLGKISRETMLDYAVDQDALTKLLSQ